MKRYWTIYKECMRTAFTQASAYRVSFILTSIITLVANILFPLVTILIYKSGASFPGWGVYEVLLIQSTFTLSSGIAQVIFSGVLWVTMQHVRDGSFEVVLLKPLPPLFYLIATTFNPEWFGLILGGGLLFGISLEHTGIVEWYSILQFVLLFIAGICVMTGIAFMMAATSFKWVGNARIPEIFDSIKSFGKYPLGIFPSMVQAVTTFIIPVGMIGFYPASAILGNCNVTDYIAIIPCMLFMLLGIIMYQHMIRLYEGVGG